jgi:flagellar motility protein MotE (MotC chaperone)
MHIHSIKKTAVWLLLLALCAQLLPAPAYAVTQDEINAVKAEKEAIGRELEELRSRLSGLQGEQADVLGQRDALNAQREAAEREIALVEQEIALYDRLVAEKSAELETAEGRKRFRELYKERLEDRSTKASQLPDGHSINDVMTLPENVKVPDSISKMVGTAMEKAQTIKPREILQNVDFSGMISSLLGGELPESIKKSKLGKVIEVYKILSAEENNKTE